MTVHIVYSTVWTVYLRGIYASFTECHGVTQLSLRKWETYYIQKKNQDDAIRFLMSFLKKQLSEAFIFQDSLLILNYSEKNSFEPGGSGGYKESNRSSNRSCKFVTNSSSGPA